MGVVAVTTTIPRKNAPKNAIVKIKKNKRCPNTLLM